jgi:hypothetical protein
MKLIAAIIIGIACLLIIGCDFGIEQRMRAENQRRANAKLDASFRSFDSIRAHHDTAR